MNREGQIVLVTGAAGYLMNRLIVDRLLPDPRMGRIVGVDIKNSSIPNAAEKYTHLCLDLTAPYDEILLALRPYCPFDVLVHGAFWFDPSRDEKRQREVNIGGARVAMHLVRDLNIPHLVHIGSTTSQGPLPQNPSKPPFLGEWEKMINVDARKGARYFYAAQKAEIAELLFYFRLQHPEVKVCDISGAIVFGPHTLDRNNVVVKMACLPWPFRRFMFYPAWHNHQMQFWAEWDAKNTFHHAIVEGWEGAFNCAGKGTVTFKELISMLGRTGIPVPYPLLKLFVWIGWKLRFGRFHYLPFPPEILEMIMGEWVGATTELGKRCKQKYSTRDAIRQFAETLKVAEGRT